jgi:hypothetical protein
MPIRDNSNKPRTAAIYIIRSRHHRFQDNGFLERLTTRVKKYLQTSNKLSNFRVAKQSLAPIPLMFRMAVRLISFFDLTLYYCRLKARNLRPLSC